MESDLNVVGIYVHTYLKHSQKLVYDHICSLHHTDAHVFYQQLENLRSYPLQSLHTITPGYTLSKFKLWWLTFKGRYRPFRSEGYESQLLQEMNTVKAKLVHFYIDEHSVNSLYTLKNISFPCVISFFDTFFTSNSTLPNDLIEALNQKAGLLFIYQEVFKPFLLSKGIDPSLVQVITEKTPIEPFYHAIIHDKDRSR